ncbi:unnamed protein product [Echinostoma caproni]|uniref:MABP domain-containing protein n=1 Tax=Echinostoma caproni TaxID=27848 RepID=A0A183ASL1_9TREM|nr:unnamed protein product [Echinostoma caproni]
MEEEYEESLTQFADLIIEGLKNSPSLRSHQSSEAHVQHSTPGRVGLSAPNNPLSLSLHGTRFGPPVNGQLTPPLKFDTVHPLASVPFSVPSADESAIYNEPCDAKPSPGNNLDETVTIYTVSLFNPEPGETSAHGSSKGERYSNIVVGFNLGSVDDYHQCRVACIARFLIYT